MMVITRIVPLSCGRVAGVLYGAMGLVVGAIVSVAALAGGFSAGEALGPLTGGIIEALRSVYGAEALVRELTGQ